MSYNPPPHYSFGPAENPQQPQSVPPSYSPQPPPPPQETGYVPQQQSVPLSVYPSAPQQGFGTQVLPAPPSGPRRSPLIPVLAVAMVIGLAGAALSLALWLRTGGDLDDTESRLDDRDAEIAQLQEDLEAAQAAADDAEAQVAEAESMRACLDDLKWFYSTPADSAEEAEAEAALQETCANWIW